MRARRGQRFVDSLDAVPLLTREQAIELARFIVRTFRLHEEEVQKLHAPFVAFAILDLVEVRVPGLLRL